MKGKVVFVLSGVLALSFSLAQAAVYKIDPAHTTLGFKVKHLMVSSTTGHFDKFEGTISFDDKNTDAFNADVTIQSDSINTAIADRDKHLKSADFFNVEKFPTLTFKSSRIRQSGSAYEIFGQLTILGVTKDVIIPVTISGPVPNPYGGTVIGISGQTTINRKDFGMTWNKSLDSGGVAVDENVTLDIDIEAHGEAITPAVKTEDKK